MDGWRLGWALCPDPSSASAVAKTRLVFNQVDVASPEDELMGDHGDPHSTSNRLTKS